MKHLPKMISLILILLLCVSALSACGDDDSGSGSKKRRKTPTETVNPTGDPDVTTTPKEERFPNRPNADTRTGSPKELSEGDVAPEFTIKMLDGTSFRLSDYDDGMVLLNFWATWCGPCVKEMPDLEQLYSDYSGKVAVRCISIGDDLDTVKQYVSRENLRKDFIGCADGTAVPDYYPTEYIPYTVLIKNGVIVATFVGSRSYNDYKTVIDSYLNQ